MFATPNQCGAGALARVPAPFLFCRQPLAGGRFQPYPSNMHSHAGHGHTHGTGRVLRISLAVTIVYVVLLVVAGIRAHSLALLSEAGHNLSDFLALLLSLLAVFLEGRPPSATSDNSSAKKSDRL